MSPRAEYDARLAERRRALADADKRDRRIADLRLFTFVLAAVLGALALWSESVDWWAVLPPAIAFVSLIFLHEMAHRDAAVAREGVRYYERGIARLEDRWAGEGTTGEAFLDPDHPYAADLDVFGPGSMFELLCAARTHAGQARLAAWLCQADPRQEVRSRQRAVDGLRGRLDLREDLARLGGDVREAVHPKLLQHWATSSPRLPKWLLPVCAPLCAAVVVTALLWPLGFGPLPLAFAMLPVALVNRILRDPVEHIAEAVALPERELSVLAAIVARLEREPFEQPRLESLQRQLGVGGVSASRAIAALDRRVQWLESRRNLAWAIPAWMLLWGPLFTFSVERWQARFGTRVIPWLEAVGEMEALASIAGLAYERPDDPFPELLEEGPPRFTGVGLGHPLLPAKTCVRNDVQLGPPQVLLVSGSNMSGKSTLLRTVGSNAVLAYAGAPVRAQSLQLSVFSLGATLRIQDSLHSGASRFYAEITRLKQLVDLTGGARPVMFLLDEILHGTNSHDRRIGAQGLVNGLVEKGALGLVTTHDLALTDIADALGDGARNVHFADELVGDELEFDYRLREGVVQRSNAIALMRAVGLEV